MTVFTEFTGNVITEEQFEALAAVFFEQLRECREFAERKGFNLVGTYIDRAMSAKTDNRPEIDSRKLTKEQILSWLRKMKALDLTSDVNKWIIVDTFINSIYLYDDMMIISFNCREKAGTLAFSD